MRRFTTPTLPITIKRKTGEVASDLVFDYLIFTIKAGKKRVDKYVQFSDYSEGKFLVKYTQEETGSFEGVNVRAEINFFTGSTRVATIIKTINLAENLIDEVI